MFAKKKKKKKEQKFVSFSRFDYLIHPPSYLLAQGAFSPRTWTPVDTFGGSTVATPINIGLCQLLIDRGIRGGSWWHLLNTFKLIVSRLGRSSGRSSSSLLLLLVLFLHDSSSFLSLGGAFSGCCRCRNELDGQKNFLLVLAIGIIIVFVAAAIIFFKQAVVPRDSRWIIIFQSRYNWVSTGNRRK